MDIVRLIALLLHTFGVFAFGAMTVFQTRRYVGGRAACGPDDGGRCDVTLPEILLSVVCMAWFAVNILLVLAPLHAGIPVRPLVAAFLFIAFLFPPLLMQVVYLGTRGAALHPPGRSWRLAPWAMWVGSQLFSATTILGLLGLTPRPPWVTGVAIGIVINGLFVAAGAYCFLILSRRGRRGEPHEHRARRRGMAWLFVVVVALGAAAALASAGGIGFPEFLDRVILRSLPLAFLFVGSFLENRLRFYDIFIKRGAALLVTIVALTGTFALTLPWLRLFDPGWAAPWVWAVLLLPIVLGLAWLYDKLGRWLDRVWLGRRFTTLEAVKHFLEAVETATDEASLVAEAERGVSSIFRAPARIDVELREARSDSPRALEVPIRSGGTRVGTIHLAARANHMPFYSEDVALLESLAEVFVHMLENVRLQHKRQEQEERAREMSLHASRSELKALRAQINPHFLFNALNAIAGLIHRDPLRADRAVEQLAEVFRYTLRRSENEWAVLDDELELARAYLEVQQARFGTRLRWEILAGEEVRELRVPTMMLQTLVENAVKHGIGATRGPGAIEIRAACLDGELRVEVADTGPGFPPAARDPAASGADGPGYGLRNVRRRLRVHFGEAARLVADRDVGRGMTTAALVLPLDRLEKSAGSGSRDRVAGPGGAA